MAIRAITDRRFYLRFLLIGLAAFGFMLWCLYDGLIGYPKQNVVRNEYVKYVEEGREDEWRQRATEEGLPLKPDRPHGEGDFIMQYIMAGFAGVASLILLTTVFRARGRWIELNGATLTSSWGQTLECDQITQIDKKRWRDKGIAKISYEQDGRKRRFVIDDFKFVREETDAILYEIEGHVEMDRIVGGPPELPPGQTPIDVADDQQPAGETAQPSADAATGDSE